MKEEPLNKLVKRDTISRVQRGSKRRGADSELIKKTDDIKRDARGRFEHGGRGGPRAGAGRPPGSQNKISLSLKNMILNSLDRLGGEEYLMKLAIENSSAFASLLGKVLPTTLQGSDSNGGAGVKLVFERHIVWPDGRREIEGVTPKALPAPGGDKDQ